MGYYIKCVVKNIFFILVLAWLQYCSGFGDTVCIIWHFKKPWLSPLTFPLLSFRFTFWFPLEKSCDMAAWWIFSRFTLTAGSDVVCWWGASEVPSLPGQDDCVTSIYLPTSLPLCDLSAFQIKLRATPFYASGSAFCCCLFFVFILYQYQNLLFLQFFVQSSLGVDNLQQWILLHIFIKRIRS